LTNIGNGLALPSHRAAKAAQFIARYFVSQFGPRSVNKANADNAITDVNYQMSNDDDVVISTVIGPTDTSGRNDDLSRGLVHLVKGGYPGPTINGLLHCSDVTNATTSFELEYHRFRMNVFVRELFCSLYNTGTRYIFMNF
jgi:hypothetical protein